jgi:hypothetical protein
MARPNGYVLNVIADQLQQVLRIDDPRVIREAKNIAFYSAIIDAAEDDPIEDAEDHADYLEFFNEHLTAHVEEYQKLVNELM